jgi:hypothetical protein
MANISQVPEMVVDEGEGGAPNSGEEGVPQWRERMDVQFGRRGVPLHISERFVLIISRARTWTLILMLLSIYIMTVVLSAIAITSLDNQTLQRLYAVLTMLLLFDINQVIYIITVDTREHIKNYANYDALWKQFSRRTFVWNVVKLALGIAALGVGGWLQPHILPALALYHILTSGPHFIIALGAVIIYLLEERRASRAAAIQRV